MDLFDLTATEGSSISLAGGPGRELDRVRVLALVIGVTSDLLSPVWQQRELADSLRDVGCRVEYLEIDAPFGHDTFLIDRERVGGSVKKYLGADDPT